MNKWKSFKDKLLSLFGGLILEKKDDGKYIISLGRIAFWLSFVPALVIWWSGIKYSTGTGIIQTNQTLLDLPPSLSNFLLTITGYNLTKHIGNTVSNVWGSNSVIKNDVVSNPSTNTASDEEGHGDV